MQRNHSHRRTFSYCFIIVALFLYLYNYITDGIIESYLILDNYAIANQYEFWRLFTFPLVTSTYEGTILFFIAFYLFSIKLEQYFRRKIYGIFILLLIAIQGTIINIFFENTGFKYSGMDGISLFIIMFFVFLNFNKRISFSYFKHFPVYLLNSFIICGWVVSVTIHHLYTGNMYVIFQASTSFVFALVSSIVFFSYLFILRRIKNKNFSSGINNIRLHQPKEMPVMSIDQSYTRTMKQPHYHSEDYAYLYQGEEFIADEDRLNEILDKILDSGQDSLNFEEKAYLDQYSKKL
jgi:hypothetical protein